MDAREHKKTVWGALSSVPRISGRWLSTFAIVALLFISALSWVESAPAQRPTDKPQSTPPVAQPQAMQAPTATKPQAKAPGKGLSTAIEVHGHWVIEVKNKDGSLARHVEFDNSLDPGFTIATTHLPGGVVLLQDLMTGIAVAPPGSWMILLGGPAGLAGISSDPNGPCSTNAASLGDPFGGCIIGGPNSILCTAAGGESVELPFLSCNLAAATNTGGFQLSGTIPATNSGNIAVVATLAGAACGTSSPTLANCAFPSTLPVDSFTSNSNLPGGSVPVTIGQSIAVSVTITFSS